jgi:hypothetical protein
MHSFTEDIFVAGCWWVTSIILATQEVEISRIMVQSQPGQIVLETLSRKKKKRKKERKKARHVIPGNRRVEVQG